MISFVNSWMFPVVEAAHVLGMAVFAGPTILVDLRNLGWTVAAESADKLEQMLKRWSHAGLAILLLTGLVMLAADWDRYRHNPAVGVKMALLVPALAGSLMPRRGKRASVISLTGLTTVVLAARAIADFDV